MRANQSSARSASAGKSRSLGLRRLRYSVTATVVSLTSLLALPALAGIVKGKIDGHMHLLNPVWTEARKPESHTYTFREPSPTVRPELRRLFPYIPKEICVALIANEAQQAGQTREVSIGGGRTTPVTVVVAPQTRLKFKNTDPFEHRLYGVDVNDFGAAGTKPGGERIWTVPKKAGVYEIRDELVPSLRMWVVAEPNVAAVGYPQLDGSFSIDVSAPGEYRVQAYFAGKAVGSALAINVTNPAATLDLSRAPLIVGKPKQSTKGGN